MKNATRLYKLGTEMVWEGVGYDTIVVDADGEEFDSMLEDGWFKTVQECNSDAEAKGDSDLDGDVTRKEMETKAKELNISFNSRTTNEKLLAKIEEALSVVD